MKKRFFLVLSVFLVILAGYTFWQKSMFKRTEVHYHAGIQVYVDSKLQDFSALKYMAIKPCEGEEGEHSEENEQIEKAHLHDKIGDVVHVEAEGAKWKDLFINLNFKIDEKKSLTGYVNGKKTANILEYPIKSYDSVIIFSGAVDEKFLKSAVTRDRIKQAEKTSESC